MNILTNSGAEVQIPISFTQICAGKLEECLPIFDMFLTNLGLKHKYVIM